MTKEERLSKERTTALAKITARCLYYKKAGIMQDLVNAVLLQKSEYLKKAKTVAEIQQISKPCTPIYAGGRYSDPPFYVLEEELIQWSIASLKAPLNHAAFERYKEIFTKKFPNVHAF